MILPASMRKLLAVMAMAASINRKYGGSMRGVLKSLIVLIRQRAGHLGVRAELEDDGDRDPPRLRALGEGDELRAGCQ